MAVCGCKTDGNSLTDDEKTLLRDGMDVRRHRFGRRMVQRRTSVELVIHRSGASSNFHPTSLQSALSRTATRPSARELAQHPWKKKRSTVDALASHYRPQIVASRTIGLKLSRAEKSCGAHPAGPPTRSPRSSHASRPKRSVATLASIGISQCI
jgi:hypothetical protein